MGGQLQHFCHYNACSMLFAGCSSLCYEKASFIFMFSSGLILVLFYIIAIAISSPALRRTRCQVELITQYTAH